MNDKKHKKPEPPVEETLPAPAPTLPADGEGKQAPEETPAPAVETSHEPRPRRTQE